MRHTWIGVPEPGGLETGSGGMEILISTLGTRPRAPGENRVVEDESRRLQRNGHVDDLKWGVEPYV
jgi:hypothetical protein